MNVSPGARKAPPADTKCPTAAQRKQAKRLSILINWLGNILESMIYIEHRNLGLGQPQKFLNKPL